MTAIPDLRIRSVNRGAVRSDGSFVLYWMTAARRLGWNFALDRAVEHAEALGRPLVVLEAVSCSYPWANDRHHRAILDGMKEHREALAAGSVRYHPYVEPRSGAGRGLIETLARDACVIVADDAPVFFLPKLLRAAEGIEGCAIEAVDSCGLLPLRAADRAFTAAYHFRRFLQKNLPSHVWHLPSPDPLARLRPSPQAELPEEVVQRWPAATDALLSGAVDELAALPIDHTVGPTSWTGGTRSGRARVDEFVNGRLDAYADTRNDPDGDGASGLSPWLHYGHVSAHEIFRAIADREGWSPARLSYVEGRRAGGWGMSPSAEAFLDQLVTWRELGYGYCAHEVGYERYETLPEWARETLELHASDPRPHVYNLSAFAEADTHDELWNAAQRQLRHEGVIQNYLRMLWGKKILEWTEHPRQALDVMIELNNRYALDGRDPNSYSGIFWTMGRFDRGWPERAVFGKVRSMSSDSTRRKVNLTEYLERWGG